MKPAAAEISHAREIVVVKIAMTRGEAMQCAKEIRHHIDSARKLVLELYDREGWKALGYASWRECVVSEFDQSQATLYRQLQAAQIEREISPTGEIGSIPGRHLQALAGAPEGDRKAAYDEAVAAAPDGKVTGEQIRAVVRRVAPKRPPSGPALDPEAVAAAIEDGPVEPADIVAQRRRGIIPAGVAVTVEEPAPGDEDEPVNVMAEQTDAEWLATLPARDGLHDVCRKIFDRDALLFRAVSPLRKKFRHHVKPLLNDYRRMGRTGTYHFYVTSFLSAKHPKDWVVCFDCKGTGQFRLIGECTTCHARGYHA